MKPGLWFLASYPKSGNTWMRLALGSLEMGGTPVQFAPDPEDWWTQVEQHVQGIVSDRYFFDEMFGVESSDLTEAEIARRRPQSLRYLAEDAGTLLIKVHESWQDESGQKLFAREAIAGVIYIVRDPRDIVASFADHLGKTPEETVTLMAESHHALARQAKRTSPQLTQPLLSWSGHVTSWLDAGVPLLLVRYEDMIANMARELRRVADFVGMDVDDAAIGQAVAATRFEALQAQENAVSFRQKSPYSVHFFRQGKAGAWRGTLAPDLSARIEKDHGAVMRRLGYLPEGQ